MYVFGPETHMTSIVAMALHKKEIPRNAPPQQAVTANFLLMNKYDERLSKVLVYRFPTLFLLLCKPSHISLGIT